MELRVKSVLVGLCVATGGVVFRRMRKEKQIMKEEGLTTIDASERLPLKDFIDPAAAALCLVGGQDFIEGVIGRTEDSTKMSLSHAVSVGAGAALALYGVSRDYADYAVEEGYGLYLITKSLKDAKLNNLFGEAKPSDPATQG